MINGSFLCAINSCVLSNTPGGISYFFLGRFEPLSSIFLDLESMIRWNAPVQLKRAEWIRNGVEEGGGGVNVVHQSL